MDAIKSKLVRHFGLNPGVAQRLMNDGYPRPRDIKAANDEDLLELPGFDQDTVNEIRQKVG